MNELRYRRLRQIISYGWKDAKYVAEQVGKSRLIVFWDIIDAFRKYYLFSNQYRQSQFWSLTKEKRQEVGERLGAENRSVDLWSNDYLLTRRFLEKWTAFKYERSISLKTKRNKAYTSKFNAGKRLIVQYNVIIMRAHYSDGTIKIGDNVVLARDMDIDYTGGLTIGNEVKISEGVKILTHNHPLDFTARDNFTKGLILTPLTIGDHASFGTRVTVLPGVKEIGRGAMISAGTVVKKPVPPYAIVFGNPGKVVGFRYPPEMIQEYEEMNYPENERIPLDVLEDNYKKYYLDRLQEIKQILG